MAFDDILLEIGGFGRYQFKTIFLVILPPLAQAAILLSQVYIAGVGDHWCKVRHWETEDCGKWNMTAGECIDFKKSLSIPQDPDGTFDRCSKFNVSGIDLSSAYELDIWNHTEIIKCDEGWEFDRSLFHSTILEEWELVCDKSAVSNVYQSVYFAGYLIGSVVFGRVADWVGRYYTFLSCCLTAGVAGVLTSLSPNGYVFAILRFITATTSYGTTLMSFVIASEVVIPSQRIYTGVSVWFLFSVGYFFLSGAAFFTYNWRLLHAIIALPYLGIIVLAFLFLTESPRWLLSKGKDEKAVKILRQAAKENGKVFPEDILVKIKNDDADNPTGKGKLLDLIRVPTMRWYMMSLCYGWFVQGFVYFGLTLGTSDLGVNPYVAFCLSGAVDFASHILSIVAMKTLGRRWSSSSCMILTGLFCFASIVAPLGPWRVTVATLGKLAIATSFDIVYVYAGEILPTPLRALGVGICSFSARIGAIVAPLLLHLGTIFQSLPLILFASSSVVGGLLMLILPETSNQPLPDTVEDTVNRKRRAKFTPLKEKDAVELQNKEAENFET